MGHPQPVPISYPLDFAPEAPAALARRTRRGRVRPLRVILALGLLAIGFLAALVRCQRLDQRCRETRNACSSLETEIGDLAVADSVVCEPGRVQMAAVARGYVSLPTTKSVPVSPALLPRVAVDHEAPASGAAGPPSAWAGLGAAEW